MKHTCFLFLSSCESFSSCAILSEGRALPWVSEKWMWFITCSSRGCSTLGRLEVCKRGSSIMLSDEASMAAVMSRSTSSSESLSIAPIPRRMRLTVVRGMSWMCCWDESKQRKSMNGPDRWHNRTWHLPWIPLSKASTFRTKRRKKKVISCGIGTNLITTQKSAWFSYPGSAECECVTVSVQGWTVSHSVAQTRTWCILPKRQGTIKQSKKNQSIVVSGPRIAKAARRN